MKKQILFFLMALTFITSCEKQEVINSNEVNIVKTQKRFYFQGNWYLLKYEDGIPIDSKAKLFLERLLSNNENLVIDHIAGEPNNVYLMENKYEFYERFPEKFKKGISRKILFNIGLNELKQNLTNKYGNVINNNDLDFLKELEINLNLLCNKYEISMPKNLLDFFKKTDIFGANTSQVTLRTGWDICEVWEDSYFEGTDPINPFDFGESSTYGNWNCYQDIEVPKLSAIPMINGNAENWDNVISSGFFKVNEGADATIFWCYKKDNFKGWKERFNTSNIGDFEGGTTYTISDFNNHHWCWFCGSLNDSISSMIATNIWEGCPAL